ncbi:MAG: MarR family transcriptional regulator [Planctomycetes bacterium]|nr:MarR family transcriptional regulator [Planctomycetota bacterium]
MLEGELDSRIQEIRRFNRFYTAQIGLLRKGLLKRSFSLTEVRMLYELARRDRPTATEIGRHLGLDGGYVSRILAKFARSGLISKRPSEMDGRHSLLQLTRKGRAVFADFDARANSQVLKMLGLVSPGDQRRLVAAMNTIEEVLGGSSPRKGPFVIRAHRPGDMGWIVHRHGVLYAQEYGWDERFEALVAGIVAEFIQRFDPQREHCWIAEKNGEVVGSVFLVRKTDDVAQLRLLLVEPWARGLGLGGRLVDECSNFARRAGYTKITLWTNDVFLAARRIYERAGYRLTHEEPHDKFGHGLVGQTWELDLTASPQSIVHSPASPGLTIKLNPTSPRRIPRAGTRG